MSEVNYAKRGVGNTALGLSIGALGAELLGGTFGNILGGARTGMCDTQIPVNRYEAAQQARIAELDTEVKLRDSNIYTDSKILEVYKYFDGEIKGINQQLCAQAVMNQKTADAFDLVRSDLLCCKNELYSAIGRERDERCCADNAIVNYVNATFYPKMVADVTTGTTSTAQLLYNPIPNCGQKCC